MEPYATKAPKGVVVKQPPQRPAQLDALVHVIYVILVNLLDLFIFLCLDLTGLVPMPKHWRIRDLASRPASTSLLQPFSIFPRKVYTVYGCANKGILPS